MTKKELSILIDKVNHHFDQIHYIKKTRRNLESLYRMLLYNSEKYKENINRIQCSASIISNRKVKIQHRELVACSIAAKYKKYCVFGTSYKVLDINKYHRSLREELDRLGIIGKQSSVTNSNNIIGKCAENKAANNILMSSKKAKISRIEFTTAIRPRTSESIPRCRNCEIIFGYE